MTGLAWVTWRQQRALLATALAVVAGFAIVGALERHGVRYPGAASMTRTLAVFLPVGLGMFWGAPLLAREVESGTAELIWTQTVSRVRWLACALTVVIVATAGVGLAILTILPAVLGTRFSLSYTYDVESAGAVGYALFAVALGVFVGAVLGRVELAMGVTVLVYGAVRIAIGAVRLHFIPLEHDTLTLQEAAHFNRDVITVDWISRQNDALITYQSAHRLATIQWIEFGLYVGLAAALLAATFVVVSRRGGRG